MNDTSSLISIAMSVFFAGLVGVSVYLQRMSKRKKGSILDFQKGLRFRNGKFVGLMEPGTYRISSNEHVVIVDMRPTAISFERLALTTQDGVSLSASASAKIQVTDPRAAVSHSKNFTQDAAVALRDALKRSVNSVAEVELRRNRAELERKILAEVDGCLPGIKYVSFGIVELTLGAHTDKAVGFAANKQ